MGYVRPWAAAVVAIAALVLTPGVPAEGVIGNDSFADTTAVAPLPFADAINTTGATTEPGEPLPCGSMGSTVWYTYTPDVNQTVSVFTAGATNFTTVRTVYNSDDLALLQPIRCATGRGHATFGATTGTTYRIQIGGYNG